MPRLKVPAYGKRLLDDRRAGKHPLEVTLVYGDDWLAGRPPRICIKPDEFEPEKYDFHLFAGLRVNVRDEFGLALADDDKVFNLLLEVAQFAALVWIGWPKALGEPAMELSEFAYACYRSGRRQWWSDDQDRAYRARFDGWFADLMSTQQPAIEERGRA